MRKAGGRLDAKLLPNAGHSFAVNWKALDAWLEQIPVDGAAAPERNEANSKSESVSD